MAYATSCSVNALDFRGQSQTAKSTTGLGFGKRRAQSAPTLDRNLSNIALSRVSWTPNSTKVLKNKLGWVILKGFVSSAC